MENFVRPVHELNLDVRHDIAEGQQELILFDGKGFYRAYPIVSSACSSLIPGGISARVWFRDLQRYGFHTRSHALAVAAARFFPIYAVR